MIRTLAAVALAIALARSSVAQTPQYDLLLKGGHVIDPANHIDEARDVAVLDGKIAAVEKDIPRSIARKTVDVTGLYVTPGLIDIHVHLGHGGAGLDWFEPNASPNVQPLGLQADTMLNSGVTTVV